MRQTTRYGLLAATSIAFPIILALTASSFGQTLTQATEPLRRLFDTVEAQRQDLLKQQQVLAEQARRLEDQQRQLEFQRLQLQALRDQLLAQQRAAGLPGRVAAAPVPASRPQAPTLAQAQPAPAAPPGATPADGATASVGAPPRQEPPRPEVQALAERGGVLTPEGTLIIQPSLEYTQSAQNRLTFRGIEIAETVLVGIIEATEADRDLLTAAVTGRYGLTDRLEAEVRVPYVYRDDRITSLVQQSGGDVSITDEVDGMGLGDIEVAGHYQFNGGANDWPIFVGNLRVKSDTGTSPFDVDRDQFGIETELPTGSGFWSMEPSITAIYPSDPAVFFANLSYVYSIAENVDEQVSTDAFVGHVDPGDSVGVSFGMGFGINERSSFSLGYKHNFIFETTTEINGTDFDSDPLDVGVLTFDVAHRLSDRTSIVLDLETGVTEDAPDVRAILRVPIALQVK